MNSVTPAATPRPWLMTLAGLVLLLIGGVSGWWMQSRHGGTADRAAIEQVVRSYILEHPEILPEAMERLRDRETRKQLASAGDDVETGFPGAVLGNPAGTVTLVEFTDYACGFCKRSVADVDALIAANPDLKVVVRELPILSPASADAARMALAAAEQGRYAAFHAAMFAAGRPAPATIEAAARSAGLDLERARRFAGDRRVTAELERNLATARQLGFDGTPSWVVGDQMLAGAVGKDELAKAIAAARKAG